MFRMGVQFTGFVRASAKLALVTTAFVVSGLTYANRAQATCGDYLQMDEHSRADHAQHPTDTPPDAPCGCAGMECRGAPVAPMAPKSPLRTHWQQDVNLPGFGDRSLSLHHSGTRPDYSGRPQRGFPLLLNRPPDARE
jgi:hypothetical protein